MRSDLWDEFNAARSAMSPADREALAEHGIAPGDIILLCGVARVKLSRSRECYEPDVDGAPVFVTPVMLEHADTPESSCPAQAVRFGTLVDLVAWHPTHPEDFAMRVGVAEWLGAIEPQYLDPEPVTIHSGVLSWLQMQGRGLFPLCHDPARLYLLLTRCARLRAQGQKQVRALRRSLRLPWPVPPMSL